MRDMKKIELHLHLEGCAPPAFIRDLAHRKKIDVSGIFEPDGSYRLTDFWDFLKVYEAASTVVTSAEDYHQLTKAVLEARAADGVIYAEFFISPAFCGGGELGAWRDYLAGIEAASAEVPEVEMRSIVTAVRHFGAEAAKDAARCAAETAGIFLTGFGMAGDEKYGASKDFAWSFDCAREAGLGLTCHAGEWRGPSSVRAVWQDLQVTRIGHGVRAIEDRDLLSELIEEGVCFEVCPGSNIALGLYPDFAAHPVERLREAGAKVTLSTDDPPYFHTTLSKEYDALAQAFGWDEAVFAQLNQTAIEAAFCDADTKDTLMTALKG